MPSDALIIYHENNYTILIEKNYDDNIKALRLAHELAHYHTRTLNSNSSTNNEVICNEKIADEYMRDYYLNGEEEK